MEELEEERATSKGTMASLENANKLLEGVLVAFRCVPKTDQRIPAKLAELQSGRVSWPVHQGAHKKKRFPCPKGAEAKKPLQELMRLGGDQVKYKKIIVRVSRSSTWQWTRLIHSSAKIEQFQGGGGLQRWSPIL